MKYIHRYKSWPDNGQTVLSDDLLDLALQHVLSFVCYCSQTKLQLKRWQPYPSQTVLCKVPLLWLFVCGGEEASHSKSNSTHRLWGEKEGDWYTMPQLEVTNRMASSVDKKSKHLFTKSFSQALVHLFTICRWLSWGVVSLDVLACILHKAALNTDRTLALWIHWCH